ncbi:MAG: trypsin-like peptidase domain-containing protein [Crocosphaera sp.]|nr:trypsin-like peptidase domain-containing protein [Crocosphaera sp.]
MSSGLFYQLSSYQCHNEAANAYNYMGVVLEKQEKLEEAIAAYKKAVDIDPKLTDDIKPLTIKSGWIQRNQEITIIGHPSNIDSPWSAVKGEVINYRPNDKFIPLDAFVADGNSGGPVLNIEGKVIAMMVNKRNKNDMVFFDNPGKEIIWRDPGSTRDVGLAYPMEIVMKKLQEWGILKGVRH